MGSTDRNRVAENILIPLFSEVYGYRSLKNLNYAEGENYPGIDLGDEEARVAFQITSTPSSEKIKETLRKFADYRLYEKYDRVAVYVLTEKQKSYSGKGFDEITQGKFAFDATKDILDYGDILREVAGFQVDKARRVLDVLESNFNTSDTSKQFLRQPEDEQNTEAVHLNMVEVVFPKTLYIAELSIPPSDDIAVAPSGKRKYKKRKSQRDIAREALSQLGFKFAVDWEVFEKKIITFHDLSDSSIPLSRIVDGGTVTPLSPDEFYSVAENQEWVFKSLLRKCLQQKLYTRRVLWQNDKAIFVFADKDGKDIREEHWQG